MNEINYLKALLLFWKLMYGVNLPVYFRDSHGDGTTQCNTFSYDFFDAVVARGWRMNIQVGASLKPLYDLGAQVRAFDFDISPVMPRRDVKLILGAPIPDVYRNALRAAETGELLKHTPQEAQALANRGIPCMIIHPSLGPRRIGHIAVTSSNFQWDEQIKEYKLFDYTPGKGVYTGNVGWTNGMMYFSDANSFGSFLNPDTLEPLRGAVCENVPAIIVEFRDRKTGEFLSTLPSDI